LIKAFVLLVAGSLLCANGKPQPNIVIILADDAGYADFGFMGSEKFETPRLDELARRGMVYDAAYATTPFCSPSRAGLLTGRHPLRYGYEFNLTHEAPPGVDQRFMGLAVGERTIGTLLREAGYRTIAIGKWHLGDQPQFHPNARGFDHFFGFLGGGSSYFPDHIKPGVIERNGEPTVPQSYLTDNFAREASEQIKAAGGRPFLLYLAFNAVHTPMDALPEDLARFAHIADPQRRRLAAMTWAMDRAVGSVIDALAAEGELDRTLIVFTNDNGGDRIGLDADNGRLRGTKGTLLEGGIRVPMIVRYPAGYMRAGRSSHLVSLMDIAPTALELAGVDVPADLDGRSLLSSARAPRELYWRYDTMAAMREGPWKLLRFPDRPAQLFNLEADIGERDDLALRESDRLRTMMRALFAWEGTIEHPRWHTGTFWSQEDVRRYSTEYVAAEAAKTKAELPPLVPR
jgi:arylsulfatase A-like enzyme